MNPVSMQWRCGRIEIANGRVTLTDTSSNAVSYPDDALPELRRVLTEAIEQAIGDGWFDPNEQGPFKQEADE